MLHYEIFEESIIDQYGDDARKWVHILPAVPLAQRNRYIKTLGKGFSLPRAFDMVMLSLKLKDEAYDSYLDEAVAAQIVSDKEKNDDKQEVNKS